MMTLASVGLAELWLPILISGVVMFFASSIAWMALPHHKAEMKALPDEHALDGIIATQELKPGSYYFPNCPNKEDMKSDAFKAKWESGPWGMLSIPEGAPSFPQNLVLMLVEFLLIATATAYVTGLAMPAGAEYMDVFRVAATCGLLGMVLGGIGGSRFMMKTWASVVMNMLDGLVFALLMAGVFAAFWPDGPELLNDALQNAPSIGTP